MSDWTALRAAFFLIDSPNFSLRPQCSPSPTKSFLVLSHTITFSESYRPSEASDELCDLFGVPPPPLILHDLEFPYDCHLHLGRSDMDDIFHIITVVLLPLFEQQSRGVAAVDEFYSKWIILPSGGPSVEVQEIVHHLCYF
jgi:hypothetical protein